MSRTPPEQVVHFLSDMYSVEQQALAQLVSAPEVAATPPLAEHLRVHYTETEEQAEMVRQRLEELGGSPSAIKDAVMKLGGKGFLLFAQAQPETPGKLIVHAYAYEAMEWAGYQMLERFARHADDEQTMQIATAISAQERTMMERLEQDFDAAEATTHGDVSADDLATTHLPKHLAEAHALDLQGIKLLQQGEKIARSVPVGVIYGELAELLRQDSEIVDQRLEALGSDSSSWKDMALAAAGLNWSMFFRVQSDTPAKLAAFVYAVLHLEIGGYEMLQRTARRVGDADNVELCDSIITARRSLASRLAGSFESAVQSTLEAVG
jgi:ferritin-like metal-binding protein YciE